MSNNKRKRVKLDFVSNPSTYIRATQIYIIEGRLNFNEDIDIISANYWGEDFISFELEVKNDASLMTERKIIALILAASPVYFYLVHKPAIDKAVTNIAIKLPNYAAYVAGGVVGLLMINWLLFKKR